MNYDKEKPAPDDKESKGADPVLANALTRVLKDIHSYTNCPSIGIRLKSNGDYPYYIHDGFSDFFMAKENSLCKRDNEGKIIFDSNGIPILECMCGNVLRGRFDPSFPFFSKKGSFWTNSTTQLLQSITPEQRRMIGRTRDTCNHSGYESVALLPMQANGEIVGLVQLNDPREDKFTSWKIERYEVVADMIGQVVIGARSVSEILTKIHDMVAENDKQQTARAAR